MAKDFNENDANRVVEEYSGKSEDELYSELIRATNEQKEEGTFDMQGLDELESALSPMLNEAQKKKLDKLLCVLRGNSLE